LKRLTLAVMVMISVLGQSTLMAQSGPPTVVAEFSGASLKWIHVAEPEFQRQKLNLDKYIVSVVEERDSVTVDLRSYDAVRGAMGSSGSYPGFEVEISKKDMKVVRSNYVR
jgi:hypothetical protein